MTTPSWKEIVKQIPNLLSAARLAVAPYLFLLLVRREYPFALALCFAAGLSDVLDGFLARRFHSSSRLGAYLDPISDKVLLSGCFLTLAISGVLEKWLAALVFGRDILILALVAAGFLAVNARSFPPSIWGKLSTAAQILFIFSVLAHLSGFMPLGVAEALKWIVAALAIWSGAHYTWTAWMALRRNSATNSGPRRDAAIMRK